MAGRILPSKALSTGSPWAALPSLLARGSLALLESWRRHGHRRGRAGALLDLQGAAHRSAARVRCDSEAEGFLAVWEGALVWLRYQVSGEVALRDGARVGLRYGLCLSVGLV